jgi:hypothetical protein
VGVSRGGHRFLLLFLSKPECIEFEVREADQFLILIRKAFGVQVVRPKL